MNEYLNYLEEKIKKCTDNIHAMSEHNIDTSYWEGRLSSYAEAKSKYQSILDPTVEFEEI